MLELEKITKKFGGIVALENISFQIIENEILGLIGPNGAGKTTLFNIITGLYRPDRGKVIFDNQNLCKLPVYRIARRGIARTFQTTKLFFNLSAEDNIRIGCEVMGRIPEDQDIRNLLSLVELESKRKKLVHQFTCAEQKRLMIALAVCLQPKLLLLDEPTAGMSAEETLETLEMLDNLRKDGTTILLIEHNMRAVSKICDRVVVLNFGKLIAEDSPGEIMKNQKVIEAYLGEENVLVA